MGPTSANGSPLRLVLLRSAAEKARLLPALDKSNREKSRLAPVVAILAHDLEFWRHLHRLHPHVDAAAWFRDDPALARETAFRNGTLQAAYFIFAIRALGADIGAVSGFDAAAVQAAFLAGTTLEVNFVCNIGYGDPADLKPRLPRLRLRGDRAPARRRPLSRERRATQPGRQPCRNRASCPTRSPSAASPRSTTCAALRAQGFVAVVNLRTAGEAGQPLSPEAEGFAAQEAGLAYSHLPVAIAELDPDHVHRLRDAIEAAPGPGLRPLRRRPARLRARACWRPRGPGTAATT